MVKWKGLFAIKLSSLTFDDISEKLASKQCNAMQGLAVRFVSWTCRW